MKLFLLIIGTLCLGNAANAFMVGYFTGGLPLVTGCLFLLSGLSMFRERNHLP